MPCHQHRVFPASLFHIRFCRWETLATSDRPPVFPCVEFFAVKGEITDGKSIAGTSLCTPVSAGFFRLSMSYVIFCRSSCLVRCRYLWWFSAWRAVGEWTCILWLGNQLSGPTHWDHTKDGEKSNGCICRFRNTSPVSCRRCAKTSDECSFFIAQFYLKLSCVVLYSTLTLLLCRGKATHPVKKCTPGARFTKYLTTNLGKNFA